MIVLHIVTGCLAHGQPLRSRGYHAREAVQLNGRLTRKKHLTGICGVGSW
jgi:hypothetical protein